jgi:hypothetical protein
MGESNLRDLVPGKVILKWILGRWNRLMKDGIELPLNGIQWWDFVSTG